MFNALDWKFMALSKLPNPGSGVSTSVTQDALCQQLSAPSLIRGTWKVLHLMCVLLERCITRSTMTDAIESKPKNKAYKTSLNDDRHTTTCSQLPLATLRRTFNTFFPRLRNHVDFQERYDLRRWRRQHRSLHHERAPRRRRFHSVYAVPQELQIHLSTLRQERSCRRRPTSRPTRYNVERSGKRAI